MDIGIVRGLLTAALLALFVGLVAWAWSRHRSSDFAAASRLPLDEVEPMPPESEAKEREQ